VVGGNANLHAEFIAALYFEVDFKFAGAPAGVGSTSGLLAHQQTFCGTDYFELGLSTVQQ
jgi:hypothetical protein